MSVAIDDVAAAEVAAADADAERVCAGSHHGRRRAGRSDDPVDPANACSRVRRGERTGLLPAVVEVATVGGGRHRDDAALPARDDRRVRSIRPVAADRMTASTHARRRRPWPRHEVSRRPRPTPFGRRDRSGVHRLVVRSRPDEHGDEHGGRGGEGRRGGNHGPMPAARPAGERGPHVGFDSFDLLQVEVRAGRRGIERIADAVVDAHSPATSSGSKARAAASRARARCRCTFTVDSEQPISSATSATGRSSR